MDIELNDEDRRRAQRRERLNEMKRRKNKQMQMRRRIKMAAPFACIILAVLIVAGVKLASGQSGEIEDSGRKAESTTEVNEETGQETAAFFQKADNTSGSEDYADETSAGSDTGASAVSISSVLSDSVARKKTYSAHTIADSVQLGDYIFPDQPLYSEYAVVIDVNDNSIVAQKNGFSKMIPASMTKVLTVLVAAEHVEDLEDTITLTPDITDYGFIHDCSSAGFEKGETVTIRDLFYGTVLPSGADAAVGLAVYVAGSQEAFVEMMNQKLDELGISDTAHMTNCVGIYDEDHYCTAVDMALILEAAIDNELCREVLSAHTYTTTKTEQHPEGIELSNWFLRRIEDKDCGGEVLYGKTGYVVQSKNCAVSYAVDNSGRGFVCVTAGAVNQYRCIEDHAGLYKKFAEEVEGGEKNGT